MSEQLGWAPWIERQKRRSFWHGYMAGSATTLCIIWVGWGLLMWMGR